MTWISLTLISLATAVLILLTVKADQPSLDVSQVLLKGQQAHRISRMSYKNVCRCQCLNKELFNSQTNQLEGNCRTTHNQRSWCFVSGEAAEACTDLRSDPRFRLKISLDACYTPAKGEGPCTDSFDQNFIHEAKRNLSCCAIHYGRYDPDTFNKFVGIKNVCYDVTANQPDEGCQYFIETSWGPALPCHCYNIQYVAGFRKLSQDLFIHCEIGVAAGRGMVDISATSGTSLIKRSGYWKARRCTWKQVPALSGPWRCIQY